MIATAAATAAEEAEIAEMRAGTEKEEDGKKTTRFGRGSRFQNEEEEKQNCPPMQCSFK